MLNPSDILKTNSYPDSNFAGMYGHQKAADPACAKSRTGYKIVT